MHKVCKVGFTIITRKTQRTNALSRTFQLHKKLIMHNKSADRIKHFVFRIKGGTFVARFSNRQNDRHRVVQSQRTLPFSRENSTFYH